MLSFLIDSIPARRNNLPSIPSSPVATTATHIPIVLNDDNNTTICSLCGSFGHIAGRCCSPEMEEIKRTLKSFLDIYEGKYAYLPEDEISNQIIKKFNKYNYLVRMFMIEIYCKLIGNVVITLEESEMKHNFIKRVFEIRREKIRNETVEQKTIRVRELEQYHHRMAVGVIQEQNRKLAYTNIMYLYDQIKIYTVITEQNRFVNNEIISAIENAYKKIQELKIKIKQEIEMYRCLYSETINHIQEMQNLSTILHNLKIDDTDINNMVQIVREEASLTSIETGVECPICLNSLESSKIYYTNCSHPFCFVCISTYLKKNKEPKCPCCRTKITKLTNYTKE
jgi:hypothetical protein